jgi:hypothetical protein
VRNSALAITAPVAAALLAILAVAWVILSGARSTDVGEAFSSTPEFLFWLLALGGQAAVWLVALPYVLATAWQRGRDLRAHGALGALALVSVGLTALILLAIAVRFTVGARDNSNGDLRGVPNGDTWPLPNHTDRVGPLVLFAMLVVIAAVIGMWLGGIALREIARNPSVDDVPRFVALRNEINTLLTIAGVLIGLGTLASGLLREAVLATNEIGLAQKPETQPFARIEDDPSTALVEAYRTALEFDPKYVALYGLFFTVLLALAFAPVYLALRSAAHELREHTLPLPPPTANEFDEVRGKRQALDDFLQTNLSAFGNFKAGIAILSPLAGSLTALVLGLPT